MSDSAFSNEVAAEVCALLVEGKSLAEICRQDGMPSYRAVFYRLTKDEAFAKDYARARVAQADADADAISDMASQVRAGLLDPQAARVAMDAYKWTASRRNARAYGEKVQIGGADDLPPVATVDATKLSSQALREIMAATHEAPEPDEG